MFYAEGTLQGVRKGVERLFIKEAMRGRNIVSLQSKGRQMFLEP